MREYRCISFWSIMLSFSWLKCEIQRTFCRRSLVLLALCPPQHIHTHTPHVAKYIHYLPLCLYRSPYAISIEFPLCEAYFFLILTMAHGPNPDHCLLFIKFFWNIDMLINLLSVADFTLQYNIVEIATKWPTSLKYIFIFWPFTENICQSLV